MNTPHPKPPPPETDDSDALLHKFGLDGPDRAWLERVRAAETSPILGKLGSYEVLAEVACGGQGRVYRARQSGTKRDVALKRLLAGSLATPAMRRRFEREIEAASLLRHPGIVTMYGVETVDEQPLLAMEWIDGVPVTQWSDADRRARPREVLKMVLAICDAVRHAHQRGVIHRDLKPSNILVDANDRPRVLDFGLAKLTRGEACDRSTATCDFVGTIAYASPEQIRHDGDQVDVRTDVYALGVVAYEMLTGRMPYEVSRDVIATARAIEAAEPSPPSTWNRGLDREVDTILGKALAKDKDRRYASVDALCEDIRRHLAGEPILAHPPSAAYQLRKLIGKHRVLFGFATTVLVFLIAFGVTAALLVRQVSNERQVAVEARRQEREARRVAESVMAFVQEMFSLADPTRAGAADITVRQVLVDAVPRVHAELADQPAVAAGVLETLAAAACGLGLYDHAVYYYEEAVELRESFAGTETLEFATGLARLGDALRLDGQIYEARDVLERAVQIAERYRQDQPIRVAQVRAPYAKILLVAGDPGAAADILRDLLETRRALAGDGDAETAELLLWLGRAHASRNDHDTARMLFDEALEIRGALGTDQTWQRLTLLIELAAVERAQGRLVEAENLYREVLPRLVDALDADHPNVAKCRSDLADVLLALGQHDAAAEEQRSALRQQRRRLGPGNPAVATSLVRLARIRSAQGEHEDAVRLYHEAADIQRETADTRPELARTFMLLAQSYGALDLPERAADCLDESRALLEEIHGPAHPDVAETLLKLAEALEQSGDRDGAQAARGRARSIAQEQGGGAELPPR